jgi:hypothetical protein
MSFSNATGQQIQHDHWRRLRRNQDRKALSFIGMESANVEPAAILLHPLDNTTPKEGTSPALPA